MSDAKLFDLIDAFVLNASNPMSERCQAIDKLDEAMGVDCAKCNKSDVAEYIVVNGPANEKEL